MPQRSTPLITNEIYHIYNRGVEKRAIYTRPAEYKRFLQTMFYYRHGESTSRFSRTPREWIGGKTEVVQVIAYCFMPNHFHLLLKQVQDGGICQFIGKLSNSYTRYFNMLNKRIGPLFQGRFKAVRVKTDEQLLHLSRYIHLNPYVSNLVKDPSFYSWSSYNEYLDANEKGICNRDIVLGLFKDSTEYSNFVSDHAEYAKELEVVKHLTFEE